MKITKRHALLGSAAITVALAMPNIARAAARQLRIAHNNTVQSSYHAGADAFAKAVASLSNGQLGVDIFPNAQIGNEQQAMKAVAEGTLDATVNSVGTTLDYAKEISLVELPYLFKDVTTARQAFDGPLGKYCADLIKPKGVFIAGWGESGLRHITANKPVRTPADVKGLKIRVQVSEPTLQAFLAMGAQAETLPFPQLAEALRTGRFEAQENPMGIIIANNLNTLQSHLSLTAHIYAPVLFAFSNDVLEDMAPAEREIVAKAGTIGAKAMRDYSDNAEKEGVAKLRAAGMTIVEDVDRAAFQKAAEGAIEKLNQSFGADTVKRVRGFVGA